MFLFEFEGKAPVIHPDAWVAPTATLIGDVHIGPQASIWFGAVLRADVGPITIGEGSNVQDNSVLHVKTGLQLEIGSFSTIAHGCVIHGLSVGDGSLIGNGSTLLDESIVGDGCMVAAGALVTPGTQIPDGSLAIGAPARVAQEIEPGSNAANILETNARSYIALMEMHRQGTRKISEG